MLFLPNAGSECGERFFPQPGVRKSERPLVGDDLNSARGFRGKKTRPKKIEEGKFYRIYSIETGFCYPLGRSVS